MERRGLKQLATIFSVALVLFLALVAKIPTASCHCNQPQSERQKAECPFGKLRLLSATSVAPPPVSIELPDIIERIVLPNFPPQHLHATSVQLSYEARAPPNAALSKAL